jgi:hypothetical protein
MTDSGRAIVRRYVACCKFDGVNIARVAVLVAVTLACAAPVHRDTDQLSPKPDILVSVTNDNLSDADVYAIRIGSRYRLGTVVSHSDAEFRVPITMLEDTRLQLFVRLIGGGGDYTSDFVQVDEETEPRLELRPSLRMSTFYAIP